MKSKDLLKLMAQQKRNKADSQAKNKATDRVVYSEFSSAAGNDRATERAEPDLPPEKQDLRVQISRKGRKGKSVTVVSGFAHGGTTGAKTLKALAKQLKGECGSGGTVAGNTIEIQGEHAAKVVSLLIKKGYKAKKSGG